MSKQNGEDEFKKNGFTICANCQHRERLSFNPSCFGTNTKITDDFINGGKKKVYFRPDLDQFSDTPPLCESVNKGDCSYFAQRPTAKQKASALFNLVFSPK